MVFKAGKEAEFDLLGNWDCFLDDALLHLKSIHFGKYADCGRLTTTKKIDVNPYNQDELFGFFMTQQAWDFCSKLDIKWAKEYVARNLHMVELQRKLSSLAKESSVDLPKHQPDTKEQACLQTEKFLPHIHTLSQAYAFGISNLINIFEPGMYNMYASQSWDSKLQNQWQELRQRHIDSLK